MKTNFSFLSNTKQFVTALAAVSICQFCNSRPAFAAEAAPTISPSFQVFSSGPQTVTITDTDGSAVIHLTTDGSTPTSSSPTYSAPFTVSATTTIQAIAIGTGGTSPVTSTVIQIDPTTANIPRSGLITWNKSDLGLTLAGSSVTSWADASGDNYNLTTNPGLTSPTLTTSAVNGFPAVTFDGVQNSFIWPAGFTNLSTGLSVFVSCRPIGRASGNIVSISNHENGDNFQIWPFWNTGQPPLQFFIEGGVPNFSSTFYLNQYQNFAFVHNGVNTGTYYLNGQQLAQSTTLPAFTNTLRSNNFIGGGYYGTFLPINYTEILIYNRPVTATELANINSYLANRYLPSTITVPAVPVAPVFSLAAGTLNAPTQLGISTAPGAVTHYTVDGTTPNSASPVVTYGIGILYSQTVNAISIRNGISSAVTSAAYTLDNTKFPAPSASDTSVMQINLQTPSAAQ